MNGRTLGLKLSLLLLASTGGAAQSMDDRAAEIRQAHGGGALEDLDNYELRGGAELTDPATGAVRRVPFLLQVSGDRSRLEMDGLVWLNQGVFGQWWSEGAERSTPRRQWEGLRNVYLTPLFPVSRLGLFERRQAGAFTFERSIERRTHYGYIAKTPQVRLDFDPETLLLAEADFRTAEGQTPVVVRYFDYQFRQGVVLPSRVERQVGDNPPQLFHIESVRLHARFDDQLFQIDCGL